MLDACPKCGRARQAGDDACARCGLLVTRFAGYKDETPAVPILDSAWAELEAAWDDDGAHQRFLEAAAVLDALDLAASRYRARQREAPGDERATRGLERAVAMAQEVYVARALAEPPSKAPAVFKVLGILFAALMFGLALRVVWIAMANTRR